MKTLIEDFPTQLARAKEIGEKMNLKISQEFINNVVIIGMGGSGIGATIVKDLTARYITKPLTVLKGYILPKFVNSETLVIACSYSGNTEETLYALNLAKQSGAHIICLTSGGKMEAVAYRENWDCVVIPSGMPPRTCLGYSIIQLMYILYNQRIIHGEFRNEIDSTVELLHVKQENIMKEAESSARMFHDKIAVIYAPEDMEGVAIRFRQQLNENSKMLAWSNVLPEMNHNELVGWAENRDNVAVVFLRNSYECLLPNLSARFRFTKDVLLNKVKTMIVIYAQGTTFFEQTFYHIHMEDWISYYISVLKNVDSMEIKVIEKLKDRLGN